MFVKMSYQNSTSVDRDVLCILHFLPFSAAKVKRAEGTVVEKVMVICNVECTLKLFAAYSQALSSFWRRI